MQFNGVLVILMRHKGEYMWNAKIERVERTLNTISVIVSYSNGETTFNETINITNNVNPLDFQDRINENLKNLVSFDELEKTVKNTIVGNISSIDEKTASISTENIKV